MKQEWIGKIVYGVEGGLMIFERSAAGFGAKTAITNLRTPEDRIRETLVHQLHLEYGRSEAEAHRYADSFLGGTRFVRAVDSLAKQFNLAECEVIEVGAGLGGMFLEMRRRGIHAVGVEPSEEWCDIIRQRLRKENLRDDCVIQGYGESLPFPDGSKDFVLSMQVLEHVKDVGRVLREINRVLRPGGLAYFTAPNYFSFAENHYLVHWFPGLPRSLGAWYLRRLGRNPAFYLNHVNNVTYFQITRTARRLKWRDLGLGGRSKVARLINALLNSFRPEITYIFQKSGGPASRADDF